MNTGTNSYVLDSKEFTLLAYRFLMTRNSFQAFLRQSEPWDWLDQTADAAALCKMQEPHKVGDCGGYTHWLILRASST